MMARPITAIIVDDEPLAIERIRRQCVASGKVNVVGEAKDAAGALELIDASAPQAIFLDVSMPGMSGLDLAASLLNRTNPPRVILVTAHDHFATEAFDLAVVDYILKPIEPDRMNRGIDRLTAVLGAVEHQGPDGHVLWVPYRGTVMRLPIGNIQHVIAERDYVRIGDGERSYLLRATLTEIASRLESRGFIRIHRSTVIASRAIAGLRHVGAGSWAAVEKDGREYAIGRTYLDAVRSALALQPDAAQKPNHST